MFTKLKAGWENFWLPVNEEEQEIEGEGSIVVFPSFSWHQVTPVTKGTRYSLVAWFVGPPFV